MACERTNTILLNFTMQSCDSRFFSKEVLISMKSALSASRGGSES